MEKNKKTRGTSLKINSAREEYFFKNETTLHRLMVVTTVMFCWILIWALVFKLGNEKLLIGNYNNLKDMTIEERIMWDIIPFNYRGTPQMKLQQFMDTVLNCFVFSPLGIMLCYLFEKKNIIRDMAICLGFSVFVEALQLLTMLGNPAPEDLLTNVIGYFIGLILYHLLLKRISIARSAKIMWIFTFIFALAFIVSIVTTLMAAPTIFKIITKTL